MLWPYGRRVVVCVPTLTAGYEQNALAAAAAASKRGVGGPRKAAGRKTAAAKGPKSKGSNDAAHGDRSDSLSNLATFQLTMLRHAMSFPQVERIAYSTCSIHAEVRAYACRCRCLGLTSDVATGERAGCGSGAR